MRTGGTFNVTASTSSSSSSSIGVLGGTPNSPWHSPIPYLFGGLAAMLGLIAFALMILACSYCKRSSYLESQEANDDIENGESSSTKANQAVYEEPKVVIMAGDQKPSFLATPVMSPRGPSPTSSSGDHEHKMDIPQSNITNNNKEEETNEIPMRIGEPKVEEDSSTSNNDHEEEDEHQVTQNQQASSHQQNQCRTQLHFFIVVG